MKNIVPTADSAVFSNTLAMLRHQFEEKIVIDATEAGAVVGFSKNSVYQRLHRGLPFPPTLCIGGRRMVRLTDLADWVDSFQSSNSPSLAFRPMEIPHNKRKRGRPTKAEQMDRRAKKNIEIGGSHD